MVKQEATATQAKQAEPEAEEAGSRFVIKRHATPPRRAPAAGRAPLVLDVGKKRKKAIKELKRGRGKLMLEVEQVVEEVRGRLSAEARGKEIVPVVLLYRQRPRRRARLL